jgi:hypothetical protein
MSLEKAVLDCLKDRKCEIIASCKCSPIPHVPEKDCVQETDSAFKDNHLKTQIGKQTELQVPIWHSGAREAFLIHVGSALETIKRKECIEAYVESNKAYMEQHSRIKLVKAQLVELDDFTNREA